MTNRRSRPAKDSEAVFSSVRRMVEECVCGHGRAHSLCLPPFETELPSRLIEILRKAESSLHVRLVELKEGVVGRYAALSYCWGPASYNPLVTTKENHVQHQRSIPISKLGQTIRDAITATDRLDIRYLWYDALCIVQDWDEDKDFQISKMRSIFENAFITLVAASAEHASSGFLPMPSEPKQVVFQLPYYHPDLPDGREGTLYATAGDKLMRDQPINMRAWTLEERLLSNRKIMFFEDRVAWECRDISLYESGEIDNMTDDLRLPDAIHDGRKFKADAEHKLWTTHTEWTKNVEWYCQRDLTKPIDKLRAIGGIAQKYHEILETEYLAGLWTGYILAGLLWRKAPSETKKTLHPRPQDYRAPSWSWAAVDGVIEYLWPDREEGSLEVARFGHEESIAKMVKPIIVDHEINLLSPKRPYGAVTGGHITLHGQMRRLRGVLLGGGGHQTCRLVCDTTPSQPSDDKIEIWPDAQGELSIGWVDLWFLALTGAAEDTRLHEGEKKGTIFVVRGLVLRTREDEEFSRVGLFEYWSPDYDGLLSGFSTREAKML